MPPNILLICADQHRHDCVGYRPGAFVRTPNIDAIATGGVAFTRCYTNSPVCGPARCALATGLQPHRIGCLDNQSYLPMSRPTFYARLRDHGYWTGFVGKLDLAKPDKRHRRSGREPVNFALGFCDPVNTGGGMGTADENTPFWQHLKDHGLLETFNADRHARTTRPGINAMSNFSHGRVDLREAEMPAGWVQRACADSPLPAEHHADAFVGREAVRWLERVEGPEAGGGPWFLQVNFPGPHDPYDPPAEYAAMFRDAEVPAAIPVDYAGKPAWVGRRFMTDDAEAIRFSRRQYAGRIALIDHWVGQILAAVERRGEAEETVVIFTADHGEMLGDLGLYIKHVPYEASARVPLAVRGPGVPRGQTSDTLVEWLDLNATVCDLAGLPQQPDIDARSLVPVLQDATRRHRDSVLCCESHFRSVCDGRWKYIESHNDPTDELYDLATDPQERHNLADKPSEDLKRMRGLLRTRWNEGQWRR